LKSVGLDSLNVWFWFGHLLIEGACDFSHNYPVVGLILDVNMTERSYEV
jgi:hypothetical protein